jgi:hypothetical protein
MAWAWFFPAEKTLSAKIWSIFVKFSLESQATAQSHGTLADMPPKNREK